MSRFAEEWRSQPECWLRAGELAAGGTALPPAGARVALTGCGTSLYVAQSVARFRELQGLGESDAFSASELPRGRRYDCLVAVSKSGSTPEVLEAVGAFAGSVPVVAVTADGGSPLAGLASAAVVLDFAAERSLVQTRFATSALALCLAHCGRDLAESARLARMVVEGADDGPSADGVEQFVFLGRGFAAPVADEAALKLREILGAWCEAYPSLEFRHGPMSAIGPRTLVWSLDGPEPVVEREVPRFGARFFAGSGDPLAELVRLHRLADRLATARQLDPDDQVVRGRVLRGVAG